LGPPQVDFYSGKKNKAKDRFLAAKLDVEGWVEVALLAGFRDMTDLTSDLAVIAEALRASKDIDVSSDGFRARWQHGQLQTWINQLQLINPVPA
jgi:la-related protein 1